jgi:BirA family transcriptional regulator, biotin operon repressor / biotin---[acetyl-CoA-carboxylase] ligase
MQLDPASIRAGVRIEAYSELASTNEAALARARAGETGPLWLTAAQQSAGRGRHGRRWISPPGNLYATLLLGDPSPAERAAELSFVTALAVHDAIAALAPASFAPRLAIKWPNDILLDGAKIAGVLIEGETVPGRDIAAGGTLAVAVGIGINCAHHPDAVAYLATDLAASGLAIAPQDLLAALSRAMLARLAQWASGDGFAAIRADWLARAAGLGGRLRVASGDHAMEGWFAALDDMGRLVLRLDDGSTRLIAAGDVFPLADAAPAGVSPPVAPAEEPGRRFARLRRATSMAKPA